MRKYGRIQAGGGQIAEPLRLLRRLGDTVCRQLMCLMLVFLGPVWAYGTDLREKSRSHHRATRKPFAFSAKIYVWNESGTGGWTSELRGQ